ncbi:MAG: ArsR family transcriptional regulator [Candidatus Thermoplasmatota archaeon]|nr:ArsR family transcriptional regulator [Candidatus Thermoplasmatota archaeon]
MKGDNMRELTQHDKKIVEIFSNLGMPKNLAKTLMYISQVDECRSADIENGANLRQPEVSVAMQHLAKKGWIEKRDKKKEGKGRPIYIYKLTSPLDNIIESVEREKLQEIESVKKNITELKSLLNIK